MLDIFPTTYEISAEKEHAVAIAVWLIIKKKKKKRKSGGSKWNKDKITSC